MASRSYRYSFCVIYFAFGRGQQCRCRSEQCLSRRECVALVDRITDGKALPEEVLEQILVRTDGVALFIEELTKTVIESGMLIDMGDRYTMTGPLPSLAIPTTLHDSLTARLDRLAPVKVVAQIAACIGRDFDYDLLAAASSMPEDSLRSALDALEHAELIIARGLPAEQYSFKHALVRDAAYAGLLKSRRVQLHAAIAGAIEQSFAHLVEAEPETLAYHLTEAGLPEKAAGYWLRAGKIAVARFANIEAIAHLRRGIEAVSGFPDRCDQGPARARPSVRVGTLPTRHPGPALERNCGNPHARPRTLRAAG